MCFSPKSAALTISGHDAEVNSGWTPFSSPQTHSPLACASQQNRAHSFLQRVVFRWAKVFCLLTFLLKGPGMKAGLTIWWVRQSLILLLQDLTKSIVWDSSPEISLVSSAASSSSWDVSHIPIRKTPMLFWAGFLDVYCQSPTWGMCFARLRSWSWPLWAHCFLTKDEVFLGIPNRCKQDAKGTWASLYLFVSLETW